MTAPRPRQGDPAHPSDDLPALVAGELAAPAAARLVGHLQACEQCRSDLVLVAGMHNAMTSAASLEQRPGPPAPAPGQRPVPAGAHPARRRAFALAAAAVVATIALLGGRSLLAEPERSVALAAVAGGGTGISGSAVMHGSGDRQTMTVRLSGLVGHPGEHYELWLLEPDGGGALAVGVLPTSGAGTYALPARLVAGHTAVDISVEPDDGDPGHSTVSVARGALG